MTLLRFSDGNRTQPSFSALNHDLRPIILICLLPIFVHLPDLLGWSSANPIRFCPGLSSFHEDRLLRGLPWIDPSIGTYAQALGKLSAEEWLSGRIPWWNYYSGVGLPLAAEMSPAAFFLPFVLLNHFFNGLLYAQIILQILAGVGTYYLLRAIGLIKFGAATGAILYEFCGVFGWLGAPWANTIPFLPWLILGIERARERSLCRSPGGWLLIGISLAF